MLVLSRQRDETIMIGDEIEITIVDIRGDKVRLGINAPRTIHVHRKEVYEAIRRENTDASQVQVDDLDAIDQDLRKRNGRSVPRAQIDQRPGPRPDPRSGTHPETHPGTHPGPRPGTQPRT